MSRDRIRVFRVKMPERMADSFDELIQSGDYVTNADAIRSAIKLLLEEHTPKERRHLELGR